jgi:hypothetical protein
MDYDKEHDAVQSLFKEMANDNLKVISKKIKAIPQENRLSYLRAADPPSGILKNVFKTANETEDYEVCAVIKALLLERGIQII